MLRKAIGLLLMVLTGCACALAQYGGGGGTGGTGSGGTYSSTGKSYGHGAAIGAAVGGAAGAGVLFLALHHRHQVVGCVANDGKSLTTDDGKHAYQLAGDPVTAGEHVTVVGKKSKNDAGVDQLEVKSVKKDMGQCKQTQASVSGQQP
jgi:hypothetical protein